MTLLPNKTFEEAVTHILLKSFQKVENSSKFVFFEDGLILRAKASKNTVTVTTTKLKLQASGFAEYRCKMLSILVKRLFIMIKEDFVPVTQGQYNICK